MDTFLVTGGTGNIGTAFVAALASDARAPRIRVATRDPASKSSALVRSLNPDTVTPVAFDVDAPASMLAALEGVTKLFVIAPFVSDMRAWHEKVAAAVKAAGSVEHLVKVSVTGARAPSSEPPPGRIPLSHWQGEEALRAVGVPATMLRPTMFMQHFLNVPGLYTARADRFYLPTGDAKVAWLDCRDIAAVAAGLLSLPESERAPLAGQAFELTGPRAHTAAEIATILSLAAKRTIAHVDGLDAFVAHCKEIGASDMVKGIYGEAAGGWFGAVDDAIAVRVLGRHTRSFTGFAIDHAAYFGGAAAE
jgi:uncharacterized protein YbjT (DUF2867 family)